MSSTWMYSWAVALGCVVVLDIGRRYLKSPKPSHTHPLPPGPPGLPFVGNVFEINTKAPWLTYTQWGKNYGDLVYSHILGKEIIIINSDALAHDILEKRNFSSRPHVVTNELCGIDFNSALLPYGDRWRLHRKFFQQTFRKDAALRFVPFQHLRTCQFLRRLMEDPARLTDHVFEYTSSIILNSTYDYDPATSGNGKDNIVEIVGKVIEIIAHAVRADITIMISVCPPILKLPSWLPGMAFKRRMDTAKGFAKQYVEIPFDYNVQKMRSGHLSPSMVCDALTSVSEESSDETWMKELKGAAATGFVAGSETSNSALMTFFLMMVVCPEVQQKAQAEIDAVLGGTRLPTLEDRASLPYVDAVLRETLRYHPVVPLSLPRAVVDDEVYAGYHFPKGAILIANVWSMSHDDATYPNPDQFIPERFFNDDGSLKPDSVENITFGFGRRICPGQYFADTSMFSIVANVLAVFKILKPLDENGVEVPVEPKFSSGVAVHPLPFGFRIVPRIPGMDMEKLEEWIAASIA